MSKGNLAVKPPKSAANDEKPLRPFKTHYAGLKIGSCSTAENAAVNCFRHVLMGEATKAQVVDDNERELFRFHWTSMGISCWSPAAGAYKRPAGAEWEESGKLRRVK